MSSKLRLGDLPFNHDDMDDELLDFESDARPRKKTTKTKRNKQDSDNYMHERSMKRRSYESHDFM
ncbi:hypothetical protein [Neptuniibacter sp.]|uniref:hypothetical protein n=1 Tax=Neptuniibacter sp. TaxID=1962643 RepID=UPI002618FB63|nr:hypothetical protein [Neptuniibacter sp.]MCP4595361.1 hypothetical protein [Neptuniibacter sp.]